MENNFLKNESGSGIQTKVILVSRILKEATDDRMNKLIDEINFLEDLPGCFKIHFPEIIFSSKDLAKNKVYFEMKHYDLPTLRRLILSE